MQIIARIIQSNSHVDYVGRVIDTLDADAPPAPDDYGFAQFVALPLRDEPLEVVGVIYNSLLFNPAYGNFGPRLSPPPDLAVLSPDYLNEQGVLIGILLLGWRATNGENAGRGRHEVPRRVLPVNQEVCKLAAEDVQQFHTTADGQLQLHYYSQIVAHAGKFAVPLLEAVIEQLQPHCAPLEAQRLKVLQQSLLWQRTVGGMRL